ncbi:MAG: MurT ligase domain-containing protein [Syntrophomonas sp.]
MNKLRIMLAIIAGKLGIILSRMLGNQGTDFPGRIALKVYPGLLKKLSANISIAKIIVTGTNGKTTTTNMLARILKENGHSFIHNQAGANMISGITTAFIEQANLTGTKKFNYALLETDEANVPLLLKQTGAHYLLVTNFFRDQLDRYGELDHTISLIKEAVKGTGIKLILNADDPLMADFQPQTSLRCWYYGFGDTPYDRSDSEENREGRYCVFCGHELRYRSYHYAQLGQFECPACHNRNPQVDFTGSELELTPGISLRINEMEIESPYQGFYNAYNVLAAVSLARVLSIPETVIKRAIAGFHPQAGRMEEFIIAGKRTILILVKNPAGLNQTLSSLAYDPVCKNVFFALNDNAADGRDISWIWDADVEFISNQDLNIGQFICSGQRSGDIAVRMKYAGVETSRINIRTPLQEGIETAIARESEAVYILSTYTALFECRKILVKLQRQWGKGQAAVSARSVE